MSGSGFSYKYGENGVEFCVCDAIAASGGCAHCFSTRKGGVSPAHLSSLNLGLERGDLPENLAENYNRLASAAGISQEGFCFTRQVHGDIIRTVSEADKRPVFLGRDVAECDALITPNAGVPLVCVSADCVPVVLYARDKRVACAVHAGWRGTALDIAGKAVRKMGEDFFVSPEEIIAAIGPCISSCCFLTHGDVPLEMDAGLGKLAREYIRPACDGRFSVDLKGINSALLSRIGVKRIFTSDDCTCCDKNRFFSHRRDGALRGSMASIIELKEGF